MDRAGRPARNDCLSRMLYPLPRYASDSVASDGLRPFRTFRRAYPSCSRRYRHDPRGRGPSSRVPETSTDFGVLVRCVRSHIYFLGSFLRRPPAQSWVRSRDHFCRKLLHDPCAPPEPHLLQKVHELYLMAMEYGSLALLQTHMGEENVVLVKTSQHPSVEEAAVSRFDCRRQTRYSSRSFAYPSCSPWRSAFGSVLNTKIRQRGGALVGV